MILSAVNCRAPLRGGQDPPGPLYVLPCFIWRLFSSSNFAQSAAFVEVCALRSAMLILSCISGNIQSPHAARCTLCCMCRQLTAAESATMFWDYLYLLALDILMQFLLLLVLRYLDIYDIYDNDVRVFRCATLVSVVIYILTSFFEREKVDPLDGFGFI